MFYAELIMNSKTFTFRQLALSDIPLMYHWFNLLHVQQFYSLRQWTEDEVLKKLEPYIVGAKPVTGFIILMNDRPIGYIQKYPVRDFPWQDHNFTEEIVQNAAGIDLFIGEESLIGKGIGHELIQSFLEQYIWPVYQYCIVDPDLHNQAAIRCYQRLNFKEHAIVDNNDALVRPVKLKLMIKQRR